MPLCDPLYLSPFATLPPAQTVRPDALMSTENPLGLVLEGQDFKSCRNHGAAC